MSIICSGGAAALARLLGLRVLFDRCDGRIGRNGAPGRCGLPWVACGARISGGLTGNQLDCRVAAARLLAMTGDGGSPTSGRAGARRAQRSRPALSERGSVGAIVAGASCSRVGGGRELEVPATFARRRWRRGGAYWPQEAQKPQNRGGGPGGPALPHACARSFPVCAEAECCATERVGKFPLQLFRAVRQKEPCDTARSVIRG